MDTPGYFWAVCTDARNTRKLSVNFIYLLKDGDLDAPERRIKMEAGNYHAYRFRRLVGLPRIRERTFLRLHPLAPVGDWCGLQPSGLYVSEDVEGPFVRLNHRPVAIARHLLVPRVYTPLSPVRVVVPEDQRVISILPYLAERRVA